VAPEMSEGLHVPGSWPFSLQSVVHVPVKNQ
jgi:hypothetical protein